MCWLRGGMSSSPPPPQCDLAAQFIYWREFSAEQLRQGHVPLWLPHAFCGMPFLGWGQAGVFYPLNWLDLVLPLTKSVNLGLALQLLLAGVNTFWWARRRGLQPAGGFVAAVLFVFGTAHFLHVFAGHLSWLAAMAWWPLVLVALDGWRTSRRPGWLLLGTGTVTLQVLAGDPQMGYTAAHN